MKLDLRPGWISGEGPENDVVVSTRARLARNLAEKAFPAKASRDDLIEVADLVRESVKHLEGRFPGIRVLDVETLGEAEREYLVDAHVASYEQVEPRDGSIIILNSEGSIAIMVNEEDHLRIQTILAGLQPASVWRLADEVDDCLAQALLYEYSDKYGYLTASLSNVGTGLRISVMLHLAGLATLERLARTLRAAHELGISVRGLFGEGTSGHGDFYQVSNEVTLGLPESEIVYRVRGVAEYLIGEERRAREELVAEPGAKFAQKAAECLDTLQRAKELGAADALGLLSPVRLAASMGMVKGANVRLFNELLIKMGIGRMSARKVSWDAVKMEMTRAPKIKNQLKGLEILER
ncbi:MAG: ATP--guanido phosphotransferase [Armatimonadota bacterium]|nr:ATP--guanido phosphotransferase [Armatimonadota bacterium]